MKRSICAVFVLLVSVPALAQDAATAPAAPAAAQDPEAGLAAIYKEADELHRRWDQPGGLDRLDRKLAEADEVARDRYETLWRRSRAYFWRSDVAPDDDQKAKLAKTGWDLGERAVQAKPDGVEGHYFAGINAGNYGDAIGIPKALMQGVEGPFLEHIYFAMKKQPGIEQAGPSLTLGRYHYKLPWPKHDGKKSEEILRAVVKNVPSNLRAKVYLAETLLDEDQAAEAKKLLDEVAAQSPGKDPPGERLAKKWGRELMVKVQDALK